jgi:hypothetical protein
MIDFEITSDNKLLLVYEPELGESWVEDRFSINEEVHIKRCFYFTQEDLLERRDSSTYVFVLGNLCGDGYFLIRKEILHLNFDLLLHKDVKISNKTFLATGNISIFKRIDNLIDEQIIIGGDREDSIPLIEFIKLLKSFPTRTTLQHYANARITGILKDYFETMTDAQLQLEKHLSRLGSIANTIQTNQDELGIDIPELLRRYESIKYRYLLEEMRSMLERVGEYNEHSWQNKILQMILLLFPKYMYVLKELVIHDSSTNPDRIINRRVDFAVVDTNGNLDIIEIKQPYPSNNLVHIYRDNYVPKGDLAGAIMQVEKYIYYLQKWGSQGEKAILEKYKTELAQCHKINITNPKGMVIIGRSKDFSDREKLDFEIIKRKYSNIMDIITYDDLINRLENIIKKFEVANESE